MAHPKSPDSRHDVRRVWTRGFLRSYGPELALVAPLDNGGGEVYLFLFRVRARSDDMVPTICHVFEHTLSLFQEPGWISGACVLNLADPRDVLIYEIWGSLPALRAWIASEARQEAHRQIAPYLTGPPEEITFEEVA